MSESRWVTARAAEAPTPINREEEISANDLAATGPTKPDPAAIPAPDIIDQHPTTPRPQRAHGTHWYLAAHGGAGATTLSAMDPNGADAGGTWPTHPDGQNVVVVTRETVSGLRAARHLAQQWGAGDLPTINLLALITIPAHPGKNSRAVSLAGKTTAGIYPRHYRLAWNAERLDHEATDALPTKQDLKIIRIINKLSTKDTP